MTNSSKVWEEDELYLNFIDGLKSRKLFERSMKIIFEVNALNKYWKCTNIKNDHKS